MSYRKKRSRSQANREDRIAKRERVEEEEEEEAAAATASEEEEEEDYEEDYKEEEEKEEAFEEEEREEGGGAVFLKHETPTKEGDEVDDAEMHVMRSINKAGKPPEAGIIKTIYVENFMCHRKLTVSLSRNANFIHGQNGSGKSAILHAVQICLGAGARRTHRARNLRELVRHESGAHAVAKVRVTLWNQGDDGFQTDVYGATITVERCIPKSGSGFSGYKLLDHQGKEHSRSRQDLDRMLDQFNIQVENPVAVLDQEESKKFLSGKPADKYQFFSKATELERMDRSYARVLENIEALETKRTQIESKLQPSIEQVRRLKKEWENHQKLEEFQEALLQFELDVVWATFQEFDQDFRVERENLEKVYAKREKRMAELTQAEELTSTQDEEHAKQERINHLVAEAKEGNQNKRRLEGEAKLAAAPVRQLERNLQHVQQRIKHGQGQLEQAKKVLEAERERVLSGAAQTEQARRTHKIKESEEEHHNLQEAQAKAREACTQISRRYEEMEPLVDHARQQVSSLQSQIGAVEQKMRSLQNTSGSNALAMFGNKCARMYGLVQRERQKGNWRGPVVGPIGSHITIAPGKDAFAAIAESTLGGGVLDRFIVTNDQDRNRFQKLRQEAGCHSRECNMFQVRPATRYRVPVPPEDMGIETVATCFHIEDDLVFNCLVDNAKIDQRALAPSKEAGEQALLQQDRHGYERIRLGFVREVYSLPNGDFWRIMDGARAMVSSERRLRQTIGRDQTAAANETKQELDQLRSELQEAQGKKGDLVKKHQKLQTDWNTEKRRERDMQKRIEKLEDIIAKIQAENETVAANENIDTTELEEDVTNAEENLRKLHQDYQDLKREREEAIPQVEEKKKELREVTARNERVIEDLQKAQNEMADFLRNLSQRQEQLDRRRAKVEQIEDVVKRFEQSVEAKEKDRNKCLETARLLQFRQKERTKKQEEADSGSDPATPDMRAEEPTEEELEAIHVVEMPEPKEYYESRLKRLQRKIEKEKERKKVTNKSPEVAYEQFVRAKQTLDAKTSQIASIENSIENLGQDVAARKKLWKTFRHHLVKMTDKGFREFLGLKGSSGSLRFDHNDKTLDLVVQKDGSEESQTDDVKALSGGERSFTTLSLLLALGERLETPFRVMDEFDVFMDNVSRKLALDALVEATKALRHRQFIFITPQDVSTLQPTNELKIIVMRPPARRGNINGMVQQTLDE